MKRAIKTIMLLCVHISKKQILELVDSFTLNGEIVMLSSYNILDDYTAKKDLCLDMDKEKIKKSDRVVIYGDNISNNVYVEELINYAKYINKSIQYVLLTNNYD